MVDVVLNHTGYGVKPNDQNPGITQADKDRFAGMLRTDGVQASDSDPVKGELASSPDFKTEDPAVRAKLIEWQTNWLNLAKTDRGDTIDYYRVDTVKHVDSTTWKAFKNALTAIKPDFKMIGEFYDGTVDHTGNNLSSGQMDALLDFAFKYTAQNFVNGQISAVENYLEYRDTKMDNTATMGQFLSSHDEDGFLATRVGGDEGKLKVAAALQITSKGQPVIYYGEELGQSGKNAGDLSQGQFSENRKDMPWDKLDQEKGLHDHYQRLLTIRAKYSKVYSKGTRQKIDASDSQGYLVFDESYLDQHIVVGSNTTNEQKSIALAVPFVSGSKVRDEYSGTIYTVDANKQVTVTLPNRDHGGTVILAVDSDIGLVAADKLALAIGYAGSDSAAAVMQDFTASVRIKWYSDHMGFQQRKCGCRKRQSDATNLRPE